MTNGLSWLKSALFIGQGFAPAEQFGVELGKFFQTLPQFFGKEKENALPLPMNANLLNSLKTMP